MNKIFASYSVGLVMSRSGLNEAQTLVLRHTLKEHAHLVNELTLVVPVVISHGDRTGGPKAVALTHRLLKTLGLGPHIRVQVEDIAPVEDVVRRMRACDEVWCATVHKKAEVGGRSTRVHALAQAYPEAPHFKFLHYYVDDTQLRGGTDTRQKKPATKG